MTALITYPLMWFAALALPALVSIYFLHHRYKQRKVSSLMLWTRGRQLSSGGRTFKRFSFPWIFLLELLILSLLVAAGLAWSFSVRRPLQRIAVVLDNSVSMQARRPNGRSVRDEALRSLGKLLSDPGLVVARTVIAGSEMIPLEAATTGDMLALVRERWDCTSHASDLSKALTTLKRTHPEADLVVVTDHPPPTETPVTAGTLWLACGDAADNLAIINAVRNPGSATHSRVLVEVANYSPSAKAAEVHWKVDDKTVHSEKRNLSAGETAILEQRLPYPSDDMVVTIAENDALDADNAVRLVAPPPRDLRIMLAFSDRSLEETIVKSVKATASAYVVTRNPELFITDKPVPAQNTAPAVLRIIKSPQMLACTGPFVVDPSHPLTDGVSFDSLVWAASTNTVLSGNALVSAGNTPLLAIDQPARDKTVVCMQLDLARSNIHLTPAWPILFWNLVNWRLASRSGFTYPNYHGGMPFQLTAQPGETVVVSCPDGSTQEYTPRGDRILVRSHAPGIYTARTGNRVTRAALNLLAPAESDLRNNRTERRGSLSTDPAITESRGSSAPWLALAALVLLFVHHRLISAGKHAGGAL